MINRKELLDEIVNYYSEWIEMAGANAPYMIQNILAEALIKERERNKFLEKRISCLENTIEKGIL